MNQAFTSHFTIHFYPLVPEPFLVAVIVFAALLSLVAFFRLRKGLIWRIAGLGILILTLLGPSVLKEEREAVNDVAVIVVDRSLSQKVGGRLERTEEILEALRSKMSKIKELEFRVTDFPSVDDSGESTDLFASLDDIFSDVPAGRRAGAVFITDGQVHDVPEPFPGDYGPVHALVSGGKNEKDRRLIITQAPSYGIVGKPVSISYKVVDSGNISEEETTVSIVTGEGKEQVRSIVPGVEQKIDLEITRPGQNIFEIRTPEIKGEISGLNNRSAIVVNGIRDRLKVLLVSGLPYIGERTWRDILKSDPGIDLVHFNILREPDKYDNAPMSERSLIQFPVHQLFEIKLKDFDLVIFDRYKNSSYTNSRYFSNMAKYVSNGGAFLCASGPEFAGSQSLDSSPLARILLADSNGKVIEHAFTPALTDYGRYHPVTEIIAGEEVGSWLRQVPLKVKRGDVLMTGADNNPLLILDRVGEGRVAQLASDQIWLWSKNYESGGPYSELVRRLIHWLMKEPELEEGALIVSSNGNNISIRMRETSEQQPSKVKVITPDRKKIYPEFTKTDDGWFKSEVETEIPGVYALESKGNRQFISVGNISPKELEDLVSTKDIMSPVTDQSGGGIYWAGSGHIPDIQMLTGTRKYAGKSWLGLRSNNDYSISGVSSHPILSGWLAALILLLTVIAGWYSEGRE